MRNGEIVAATSKLETESGSCMTGDHNDVPRDFGPAFAWGIALNAAYVVVEAGFGFLSGSLALVADAAHNLMTSAAWFLPGAQSP